MACHRSIANPAGDWKRDLRHSAYVGKHVLTANDRVFIETDGYDDERFTDSKIYYVSDPSLRRLQLPPEGHSFWNVKGFQRGSDDAAQFLFGTSAHSVGVGAGQNVNQIGLISAFFYAEKLADDVPVEACYTRSLPGGGIQVGPTIPSPVTKVGVKNYYQYPAEVWHIQYVYEDDPDKPDDDVLEPFQPFQPPGN